VRPFASDFGVRSHGTDLGVFHSACPATHNVLNALAAIGVALELKVARTSSARGSPYSTAWTGGFRFAAPNGTSRSSTITAITREIRARSQPARLCGYSRITRHLSATPIHAHLSLMDEFASLRSRKPTACICCSISCGIGETDRGRDSGDAGRAHPAVRASLGGVRGHDRRAVDAVLEHAEPGDAVLTLEPGNVVAGRGSVAGTIGGRRDGKRGKGARIAWRNRSKEGPFVGAVMNVGLGSSRWPSLSSPGATVRHFCP